MSISRKEIVERLNEIKRPDLINSSTVKSDNFLCEFTEKLEPKPEDIIEIGTHNGIGTVVLASIGKIVCTYDITYRDAEFVWNLFEVREKIRYCVIRPEQIGFDIRTIMKWPSIFSFNLAVVDGNHAYESVKHDFELVKFCKRVLFHDIWYEPARRFVVNELKARIVGPKVANKYVWGYWEEK